jgi:hypothetical protein
MTMLQLIQEHSNGSYTIDSTAFEGQVFDSKAEAVAAAADYSNRLLEELYRELDGLAYDEERGHYETSLPPPPPDTERDTLESF